MNRYTSSAIIYSGDSAKPATKDDIEVYGKWCKWEDVERLQQNNWTLMETITNWQTEYAKVNTVRNEQDDVIDQLKSDLAVLSEALLEKSPYSCQCKACTISRKYTKGETK